MPFEPSVSDVHINQALTNLSVAMYNEPSEFMAPFIFPSQSVSKFSDLYWIYNTADFMRDDVQLRGPGAQYPEVGYGHSTGSYQLIEYALAADVPDEVRWNNDAPLQPDADAIAMLTQKFLIASERRAAAVAMNTSVVTQNSTLAGTDKWSDYAGSDPIANIWAARKTIRRAALRKPNKIAMGEQVWEDSLVSHPQFIERIKYTDRATPDRQMAAMKELFMVGNIRSSGVIYNSANKGATAVYGDIWGDDLLLFYSAPGFSLRQVSFGFTLTLNGTGPKIVTKRDDLRDRDVHQGKHVCQEKVISPEAAYLFKDVN